MAVLGAPLVPLLVTPNGKQILAYYGDATSCTAYNLDPTDWADAQRRPDSAKWSTSPQSTKIYNRTYTVAGTPPRGSFGGVIFPTGSSIDTVGTYSNLPNGSLMDM